MVDQPVSGDLPLQRIVAAAILNAGIAAIVILPARVAHRTIRDAREAGVVSVP